MYFSIYTLSHLKFGNPSQYVQQCYQYALPDETFNLKSNIDDDCCIQLFEMFKMLQKENIKSLTRSFFVLSSDINGSIKTGKNDSDFCPLCCLWRYLLLFKIFQCFDTETGLVQSLLVRVCRSPLHFALCIGIVNGLKENRF